VFRSLLRAPAFTVTVVVTLGLGIGVVTAGFSLLNWLLLRPLPGIVDGERLAVVAFNDTVRGGVPRLAPVAPAQVPDLSRDLSAVAGLASYTGSTFTVGTGDTAIQVRGEYVMPAYFRVLGTGPRLGRLLADQDDLPGAEPVAVIGHDLWVTLFKRDTAVVGRRLVVNTETFTVMGVAPAGFGGVSGPGAAALWIPNATYLRTIRVHAEVINWTPSLRLYWFVARVSPGATFQQAEAELDARGRHLLGKGLRADRGVGLPVTRRAQTVDLLRLVMGVTGVVLLVACANVAGLVLLRGIQQWGASAVRAVFGAGVGDLVRLQLLESVLLALGGGILGVAISWLAVAQFRGKVLLRGLPPLDGITLDLRVLLFAACAASVPALLCALAPVPLALRVAPMDAVRAASRTVAGWGRRFRVALTVLQLAVSLALVAGAMLLVRTVRNLTRVELGFDPRGVALVDVQPARRGYQGQRLQAYYADFLEQLRALPGMESASLSSNVPLSGGGAFTEITHHGADGVAVSQWAALATVSPDYFRTLGITLVRGRSFTETEFVVPSKDRPPLLVVNQALARRLFGAADPLGKAVTVGPDPRTMEVVGVVPDTRWNTLGTATAAWEGEFQVFQLFHVTTSPGGHVLVRASGQPPAAMHASLQRIAVSLDRQVPVVAPRMLNDNLVTYLGTRVLLIRVLIWLAGLGLAIAAVGVYGLVAYRVASRTRELGIRLALGASSAQLVVLVLRESAGLAVLGTLTGIPAVAGLGRVLRSLLHGVDPLDLPSLLMAVATLFTVVLLAAWIPARRAARLPPMIALRTDC